MLALALTLEWVLSHSLYSIRNGANANALCEWSYKYAVTVADPGFP